MMEPRLVESPGFELLQVNLQHSNVAIDTNPVPVRCVARHSDGSDSRQTRYALRQSSIVVRVLHEPGYYCEKINGNSVGESEFIFFTTIFKYDVPITDDV